MHTKMTKYGTVVSVSTDLDPPWHILTSRISTHGDCAQNRSSCVKLSRQLREEMR